MELVIGALALIAGVANMVKPDKVAGMTGDSKETIRRHPEADGSPAKNRTREL